MANKGFIIDVGRGYRKLVFDWSNTGKVMIRCGRERELHLKRTILPRSAQVVQARVIANSRLKTKPSYQSLARQPKASVGRTAAGSEPE
jgi:hypothetical protein